MLQLVPYLIGKGEVSIAEAADEFDVTPDQMRAMVETLTVIGLPGDGGYWQMANDLFDIDWDLLDERDIVVITNSVGLERAPKLTAREAAALLTGLQLARAIPGVGDTELFAGLLAKLARGASSTPADVILAPGPVDAVRDAVADGAAAAGRGLVHLQGAGCRADDPHRRPRQGAHRRRRSGTCRAGATCAQAMRTFHLDRVSDLELTDIPIEHARGPGARMVRVRAAATSSPASGSPSPSRRCSGDYLDRAAVETVDGRLDRDDARRRRAQPAPPRRAPRRGRRDPRAGRRRGAPPPTWAEAGLAQYR